MTKIQFLPTDYQAPKASNFYMKFQEGENKFRILSQPILGWEDWQDKKPVRFRFDEKPARPIDPKKPIKHFWAMIVWNYLAEEIQILHITQSSIRKSLQTLCMDKDWGEPYSYDIKIVKTGKDLETEYVLNPLPHKPLPSHVIDLFNERRCNLEALFDNEDPFSKENTVFTPGIFSANVDKKISMEQAYDLEMILAECGTRYRDWVFHSLEKQYSIKELLDLPIELYQRVKDAAEKTMNETHAKQRAKTAEDQFQIAEGQ
jgi:hypothetical protein